MKKYLKGFFSIFILFYLIQPAFAKINSLSFWNLQDPLPTQHKKIDQSFQLQVGVNGVSPMGADGDAKFYSLPYQVTYGLLEKLEIGAGWGFQVLQRKGRGTQAGFTDIAVATRYKIFEVDRAQRLPGVDIELGISIPMASYERGLGTGGLGLLFRWGIELPTDSRKTFFGVGYKYYMENSDNVQVGSVLSYNAGIILPWGNPNLSSMSWKITGLIAELKGLNHSRNKNLGKETGLRPDEFYFAPGVTLNFGEKWNLNGSVLAGLTKESSDIGINIELKF